MEEPFRRVGQFHVAAQGQFLIAGDIRSKWKIFNPLCNQFFLCGNALLSK
jgi:hypothetical protein